MPSTGTCSCCGAPLVQGALGNRCARCLMGFALTENEAPPEVQAAAPPGARRFGDYELLEEIGRGGMGVVYRARQLSLNRIVAVKMLPARPFAVPEQEERLHVEAEVAGGLSHPNIVTIYEFGEHEGQFYFALEFVEGQSLAQLTRHHSLPPTQAARYLKTIAEAVHCAHEHGILHRDLKPSNILVDLHDQVRITDFGLAKRLGTDSDLTVTGQLIGSPNYLSPEQAAGRHRDLTPRSDVYSLGAVLYQLLTGRPPLIGASLQETLVQIREKEVPSPRLLNPRIAHDLETICLKCLQKEPARRYGTAKEMAEDLGRFLENKPILARRISALGRCGRWCRRNPRLASFAGVAFLSLLVGLTGILWQWGRAESERTRAEAGEQLARRNAYAADMLLAQQALEDSDLGRAVELLNRHRPRRESEISNLKSQIQADLRGWEWRYLWSRCHSEEQFTLFRGSNYLTTLAYSADGKWLAARREAGTVTVWDAVAKRVIAELPATIGSSRDVAIAPHHGLLAWGCDDGAGLPVLRLWDADLQREIAQLPHSAGVVSVAFSPDATVLATLTGDGAVSLWEVASRQLVTNSPAPRLTPAYYNFYGCVRFSPDGRLLAIGGGTPRTLLWDWRTGEQREPLVLPSPADGVTALALSRDGKFLAAGGGFLDHQVHLWDLETGTGTTLAGHKSWIVGLAFAPDGHTLASASADQTIGLWDVTRRIKLRRLQGHENEVRAVAWSPDGRQIVSAGKDGSVRSWDPAVKAPAAPYQVLPDRIRYRDLAFLPDGNTLLTLSHPDGSLALWDARTLQALEKLLVLGTNWRTFALSTDGHLLATDDWGGNVRVLDLASRLAVTNFVVAGAEGGFLRFSDPGHWLIRGALLPDGSRSLTFWEVATWAEKSSAGIDIKEATGAKLAPDERTLAIPYSDGRLALWNLHTRQRDVLLDCQHLGLELSVDFSPTGQLLAVGGTGGLAMIWDAKTRQARPMARAHLNAIHSVAFSPDGRRLIISGTGANDAGRLWDVESGREMTTLTGEPGMYHFTRFSPDGNSIFAVCDDGTVLLWRAPSFAEVAAREQIKARVR